MSGNTVTRADLSEAIHQKIGLSQTECATLVELVLKEIKDCLERGETVKLSSFGVFVVRKKGQRMGRNPKTGEEATTHPAASSRSSRPRSLRSGSIPLVHDLREKPPHGSLSRHSRTPFVYGEGLHRALCEVLLKPPSLLSLKPRSPQAGAFHCCDCELSGPAVNVEEWGAGDTAATPSSLIARQDRNDLLVVEAYLSTDQP
jgi:integration host factor subunit alpha